MSEKSRKQAKAEEARAGGAPVELPGQAQTPAGLRWVHRVLVALVLAAAAWLVWAFASVVYVSLAYPELGSSLMTAFERLSQGKPIYGGVSREFIPPIYFPGLFVAVWAWTALLGFSVGKVMGFVFFILVLTLVLVGTLARISGASRRQAVLAVVIWTGLTSFGVVVPLGMGSDILMSVLVLGGVICLAAGSSWRWLCGSAACFSAAAFTKQNMAPLVLLPASLGLVTERSGRKVAIALIPPAAAVAGMFLANRLMGGKMFEWTMSSVAGHPFTTQEWASKLSRMVVGLAAPCLALVGLSLATREAREWRQSTAAGPLLALCYLMVIGYAGHMKLGGGPPHLWPFYTVLIPLALGWGVTALQRISPAYASTVWLTLVALQLGRCLYDPRQFTVPMRQAYERQTALLDYMRGVEGPVLYAADTQSFLVRVAGKPPVLSRNELHGLLYGRHTQELDAEGLPPDMRKAIEERYYDAVIYDLPTLGNCPLLRAVRKYYVLEGTWPGPGYDPSLPICLGALTTKELYRRPGAEQARKPER